MGNSQDSINSQLDSSAAFSKSTKKYPAPQPPLSRSQSSSTVSGSFRRNSSTSLKNKGIENVHLAPHPQVQNGSNKNPRRASRTPSIKKYPAPNPPGFPKGSTSDVSASQLGQGEVGPRNLPPSSATTEGQISEASSLVQNSKRANSPTPNRNATLTLGRKSSLEDDSQNKLGGRAPSLTKKKSPIDDKICNNHQSSLPSSDSSQSLIVTSDKPVIDSASPLPTSLSNTVEKLNSDAAISTDLHSSIKDPGMKHINEASKGLSLDAPNNVGREFSSLECDNSLDNSKRPECLTSKSDASSLKSKLSTQELVTVLEEKKADEGSGKNINLGSTGKKEVSPFTGGSNPKDKIQDSYNAPKIGDKDSLLIISPSPSLPKEEKFRKDASPHKNLQITPNDSLKEKSTNDKDTPPADSKNETGSSHTNSMNQDIKNEFREVEKSGGKAEDEEKKSLSMQNSAENSKEKPSKDPSASPSSTSKKSYKRSKSAKLTSLTNKFEEEKTKPPATKKTTPKSLGSNKIGIFSANKLSDIASKFEKDSPVSNDCSEKQNLTKKKEANTLEPLGADSKRRGSIGGINISKFGAVAKPNEFLLAKKSKSNISSDSTPSSNVIAETKEELEKDLNTEIDSKVEVAEPHEAPISSSSNSEIKLAAETVPQKTVTKSNSAAIEHLEKPTTVQNASDSTITLPAAHLEKDLEVKQEEVHKEFNLYLSNNAASCDEISESITGAKTESPETTKVGDLVSNQDSTQSTQIAVDSKAPLEEEISISSCTESHSSKDEPSKTEQILEPTKVTAEETAVLNIPQPQISCIDATPASKNVLQANISKTVSENVLQADISKDANENVLQSDISMHTSENVLQANILLPNAENVSQANFSTLNAVNLSQTNVSTLNAENLVQANVSTLNAENLSNANVTTFNAENMLQAAVSSTTLIAENALQPNVSSPNIENLLQVNASDECSNVIQFEKEYNKQLEQVILGKTQPMLHTSSSNGDIFVTSAPSLPFNRTSMSCSKSLDSLGCLSAQVTVVAPFDPLPSNDYRASNISTFDANSSRNASTVPYIQHRKYPPRLSLGDETDTPCDLLGTRLTPQSAEVIRYHSTKHNELMEKIRGTNSLRRRKSRDSQTPEKFITASEILKDAEERLARAIRSPLPMSRTSLERESSLGQETNPSQLDILMPLPNSEELGLADYSSRSSTPFDLRDRSPTPAPKRVVEETESLLSETDILLRKSRSVGSLRRSFARSMSGAAINRLAEVTAELSEQHGTAHLAGERLEAEQAERMKLEKEVSQLQNDVKRMTSANDKLEMERLALRNEVLQHSELNGDVHDLDEAADASLYKRKYEWSLKEMELLKKQLKQQQDDDLDQLLVLKKQLEKKVYDANEEADEQRQVAGQQKKKSQRLQAEMNDIKILLEEQTSRNNLLEKKQRKFDQDMNTVHEELKNERMAKEKIQRERDQILSEKYSFEQEVCTLKLELDLKDEKVSALKKELADLSFTGKVEEETALLKKVKHDLELRVKDQEEELDDLAGQVQMLEAAKIRLEMSLEQTRKENRKEAQQRDEELEEVRMAAQKKVKALELHLEAEHSERTQLVREKHDLERRLADAHDRHVSTVDEEYVHRLRKELKKTKALLKDTQTMLEKNQSEGSSKMILRQLKTQLEDAEFAKTTALKARQSAEADMLELQTQVDEALRAKKDAEDRYSRTIKEKADMQTQLEESEEEVAEVMKKYKATVSQLSVDQITISEQTQLIAELEHDKQVLNERLSELSSKVEVLEGETASIHTQKRLQMKIKELESKLDLELTTRQRLENQISRLKDQVDRLGSECDASRLKENQAVDHSKKIIRQLREAKEDSSTIQQKYTEVANRKQEVEKQLELSESEIITLKSDLKLAFKRIEDLQQALQGEISDSDSDISDSGSENDSLSSYLTASSLKYQRSSSSSSHSAFKTPPSEVVAESKDDVGPKAASERSMSVISEDFEEEEGAGVGHSYRESFA